MLIIIGLIRPTVITLSDKMRLIRIHKTIFNSLFDNELTIYSKYDINTNELTKVQNISMEHIWLI